jgi:hypothetical protein
MTRLKFRYTPLDSVDFDVCAGPPRPEPPASEHRPTQAGPARVDDAKILPEPAEG